MADKLNSPNIFNILKSLAMLSVFGVHSLICIRTYYPNIHFPWCFYTPAWAAMWMFFILSGYLLGKGFYNKKYETDFSGIIIFWINRLIRILPPYLIFLLIMLLFVYTSEFAREHFYSLIPLLTFTDNIAAIKSHAKVPLDYLWFISTIMQLYFLAPFGFKYLLSKIKLNKLLLFFLIAGAGLSIRLIYNYFKMDNMEMYFNNVLIPSWTNLDLFFGGMLLNLFTFNSEDSVIKKWLRPVSLILLIICLVLFTYNLQYGFSWFYKFIGPTVLLMLMALIIYAFDYKNNSSQEPLCLRTIIKNPLRLFDAFGTVVLGFYIYHSYLLTVPLKIYKASGGGHFSDVFILLSVPLTGFCITVIVAALNYIFIEKPANRLRYSFIRKEN